MIIGDDKDDKTRKTPRKYSVSLHSTGYMWQDGLSEGMQSVSVLHHDKQIIFIYNIKYIILTTRKHSGMDGAP